MVATSATVVAGGPASSGRAAPAVTLGQADGENAVTSAAATSPPTVQLARRWFVRSTSVEAGAGRSLTTGRTRRSEGAGASVPDGGVTSTG